MVNIEKRLIRDGDDSRFSDRQPSAGSHAKRELWVRATENTLPHLTPVRLRRALAPAGTVAEFINSPMRSRLQSHLFCAAVAFLAACQSSPVNQGIEPNKPGSTAAPPTTPSSYEVDSFDPFRRDPGIGLRGSSYFGRGP